MRNQGLTDEVLGIYEITLIYHYTESVYENTNEVLPQNKGIITTPYAQFLADTLQKLPDYQNVVFRGATLLTSQKQRYIATNKENILVTEPLFLSTSRSEIIANLFSKGNTLFTIFTG
ncbi:MAG: hypothetical protein U0Y10_06875 [Spirosomataceae bacterium]